MTAGPSSVAAGGGRVAPWRRVLARLADGAWQSVAGVAVWYVVDQLGELHWRWVLVAAAVGASAVQVAGESLLLWALATTPGKAMLGLRVVEADGMPLRFRTALLRALKTTAFGAAFWLGPLAIGAAAANAWRLFRGRPLPWERGGDATVVRAQPSGARRQAAAWLAGSCIALLASAGPLMMLAVPATTSAALSQDLRRSITGQWLWLHPFSGRTRTLDADWRLVHESVTMALGIYEVSFARSDDAAHQVKLSVNWGGALPPSSCLDGELDLQDAGFVVIRSGEAGEEEEQGGCTVRGARLDGDRVVYGQVRAARKAGAVFKVFHTHTDAAVAGRAEAERLATWLLAEAEGIVLEDGRLVRHYWRNDLTGERAMLPGDWALDELSVSADSVVNYIFVRWPGSPGAPAVKDAVFLAGLPRRSAADAESAVLELARLGGADGEVAKEVSPTGDTSYLLRGLHGEGRIVLRSGRRYIWLMVWANNESGTPPGSVEAHALLRHLLPTLR